MFLIKDIRFLIKHNVWISVGFLMTGIVLLKFSDSSDLIKLIRFVFPSLSSNLIGSVMTVTGLIALGVSFFSFAVWIKAANEKRQAQRQNALRHIAQTMGWDYSEYLPLSLRAHIDAFMVDRARGIPSNLYRSSQTTANFLSKKFNEELIIIFDCVIVSANDRNDSSTSFETVYLVVSDNLDLPYFQTQPESWLGDNAVSDLIKKKAGVADVEFPERPEFSRKYVVDVDPAKASQIFTAPVFDFFEQHQLNRIIGDGKMLALVNWQIHPIAQADINANLDLLQQFYRLLISERSA